MWSLKILSTNNIYIDTIDYVSKLYVESNIDLLLDKKGNI